MNSRRLIDHLIGALVQRSFVRIGRVASALNKPNTEIPTKDSDYCYALSAVKWGYEHGCRTSTGDTAHVAHGSIASFCQSADCFRSSSNNGHFREQSLCLKRA
jgi:hypothetical protein